MAEGGGLLNRYTGVNLYRGFESPSLRHIAPANEVSKRYGAPRSTCRSPSRHSIGRKAERRRKARRSGEAGRSKKTISLATGQSEKLQT